MIMIIEKRLTTPTIPIPSNLHIFFDSIFVKKRYILCGITFSYARLGEICYKIAILILVVSYDNFSSRGQYDLETTRANILNARLRTFVHKGITIIQKLYVIHKRI